jgi:thiamine pyrophosphokinase
MPAKGSDGESVHAIVVAGSLLVGELNRDAFAPEDLIIAVDAGADALDRVGVIPSLLVGDFDSISASTLADLRARGVECVSLATAKDETDTEAALRLAVNRGATEITVFNALGGPRLDHLLGNLLLLTASWLDPVRVTLVDGLHRVFLVKGDGSITGRPGDTVSLLPLSAVVKDVRTDGLLYPLRGEPLLQGATRGVSNEMTGDVARVTHGPGDLLLVHYRGR